MNRRELLKLLSQTSGAVLAASVLEGCQSKAIAPMFLFDPAQPLPDHLITPLTEFYVQSYALPSRVNVEQWQLKIQGAVDTPITLTFSDLLQAPQEEFYLTMECIGNPAGGNLIGNAKWTGTPLLPLLQRADVQPEVIEFALKGADWYETTLPVKDVMRPDVRLVHRMNDEPLTVPHGFPVRIIVPGHFGQKQPKWLVEITAIAKAKTGYWENQGWSNTAEIPTHGMVRQIHTQRVWDRNHQLTLSREIWRQGITIAGVALDRDRPIDQIEVSFDNGATWQVAEQNRPTSPHEWTLWRQPWQPKQPGKYGLLARAKSARQQQPLDDRNGKDGSSGVLRIQVTLQA